MTKWEWRMAFVIEIRKASSGGKTQWKETAWKTRAKVVTVLKWIQINKTLACGLDFLTSD
jgi:hypothetical protein